MTAPTGERPKTKVTLDIFSPSRGQEEFQRTVEPMFNGGITHRAYKIITEGRPRANGKPTPDEQKYFSIKRTHGQESRGSRFMRRLDRRFYESLGRQFDQDGLATSEAFYNNLLDATNEFKQYVQETLFAGEGDVLRSLNEVTLASTPAKLLRKVTGSDIDPRLRQESLTQAGLVLTAAELLARMRNLPLLKDLSDVMDIFNETLFSGETGRLSYRETYALYDNENKVIGIDGKFMPENLDSLDRSQLHWKKHNQASRMMEGVGEVMVDITPKSIGSSIAKALRRAEETREKNGDNEIDIAKSVKDVRRMRFVLLDAMDLNDPKVDLAIEKVKATLSENYGNIEEIYRDDDVNGVGDESSHIHFKRLKVKFENAPDKIEIMFFDQVNYLMNDYSVGHVLHENSQSGDSIPKNEGKLSGGAHELYERWRLIKLVKYLWPEGVNGYSVADLKNLALQGYYQKALDLINEKRVDNHTASMLYERNKSLQAT
jgi:hypothetical protein